MIRNIFDLHYFLRLIKAPIKMSVKTTQLKIFCSYSKNLEFLKTKSSRRKKLPSQRVIQNTKATPDSWLSSKTAPQLKETQSIYFKTTRK